MTTTPEQAVIQADRDCAENAIRAWVLMGANDDAWPAILAQAFATQRLAATKSTDCGCGMGVLCFRDRPEPALDQIAFAVIEGSAGLKAAEHAKEFQTGNWRDALRSAQAVSRLAHSQPATEGLREAWHPIETAPKDRQIMLAREFDRAWDWRVKCGGWHEDGRWEVWGASWAPTMWAEMLPPPTISIREPATAHPLTEPQPIGREGEG